jgi:hypothetical protein
VICNHDKYYWWTSSATASKRWPTVLATRLRWRRSICGVQMEKRACHKRRH